MSGDPSAGRALGFAVAIAGVLAALEVGAWAARDAIFLSEYPAHTLPIAMMAQGALSIVATFALSAWLRRVGPTSVAPTALACFGALFALMAAALSSAPELTAAALYLVVSALGPLVVSTFWSVVNERFDPYSARRAMSRMAAAGALGGVAGGIGAERVATLVGFPTLLAALGIICVGCAAGLTRIGSGPAQAASEAPDEDSLGDSGLQQVARHPLLRKMALLMFTVAIVETLVDYALKVEAAAAFPSGEDLVRFFAAFYTACWLLSFFVQASLGDRTLRRFGLAGAIALLPGSVAFAGTIGVLFAKLWSFALVRGAETVASISFFRTGFQLLYTPLPRSAKRPAKAWVDVASGSLGDLLGAAVVLGLLATIPDLPSRFVVLLAVVLCLPALLLVRQIHGGYVAQLAASLRSGRVDLRPEDALDATTARTIAETRVGQDRQSLLEKARAFHEQSEQQDAEASLAAVVGDAPGPSAGAAATSRASHTPTSELPRLIEELRSGEPDRIRRVLLRELSGNSAAATAVKRQVAPHVVPLLADDRIARAAQELLRSVAPRIVGLLTDALLDADAPPDVRIRVSSLLARVPDKRAMSGLWQGLDAADFAVRIACARGAVRLLNRDADLRPDRTAVYGRVERELGVDDSSGPRGGARPETRGERSVLLHRRALAEVDPRLEHVFTLLALTHEREVMASVLAGISGPDAHVRGTALEYLESVLSPEVRAALWPKLSTGAPRVSDRSREQIADELLRSSAAVLADPEESG